MRSGDELSHDWLFFTGENWTPYSQRGQAFALELAKRGDRVFFFEPMISIPKLLYKIITNSELSLADGIVDGVYILRTRLSLWRFRGSRVSWLDRWMFNLWYRKTVEKYNVKSDAILYINMPYWWWNIIRPESVMHSVLVYDCIDDCKIYSRNDRVKGVMDASEKRLVHDADFVFATANALFEKIKSFDKNVDKISNGVDTDRFSLDNLQKNSKSYLNNIDGPIFGFVGALYYWIDFDSIIRLADAFPDFTIVLVGPTDSSFPFIEMGMRKNIKMIGPVPYADVPHFVSKFDVCLNVFKADLIGDTVNPIKIYEYLAMGKPVICSRTMETENFKDLVYLYDSPETLIDAAKKALEDKGNASARIKYAKNNNWANKVDMMSNILFDSKLGEL